MFYLKAYRALMLLLGGMVAGCLLVACGNQTKVDDYENIQHPPDLHVTPSLDSQSGKNVTLLKNGLGDQIKLNESKRGSVLLLTLDKDTALEVIESTLEYHHIEIIDQNHEKAYIVIQMKSEKPTSVNADPADEDYGPDGIYSSGEGFLENVSGLWGSKTKREDEDIIQYQLSAKQKEDTTVISAHPLTNRASFKKTNVEHQKQLFLLIYKSLHEGLH